MPERYVPEVTRVEVAGRKLRLSSLDKVMYPSTETTKGEVLSYYAQVAPVLLPHLADRPVTRVRWPHGVEDQMFFEKNLPSGAPSWLPRVPVDDVTYPLVTDLADLTYLVNLNSLELHVPQWTFEDGEPQHPNRLVIDLDPGQAGRAARVRAGRPPRPRPARRPRARAVPRDLGEQGHAALRRARRRPQLGPGARPRPAARPGDDQAAPRPRPVEDDEVAAARQGLPRLEPERRGEDDDQPVLDARARAALRRRPPHVGRGGTRCGGTGLAQAADVRRGARAPRVRRRPRGRPP